MKAALIVLLLHSLALGMSYDAGSLAPGVGYTITANGAGTAYTLTATPAALDFGTTDPSVTLAQTGTYLIIGSVNVKYTGATFAASRTVTLKWRRTNNTATDLGTATPTLTDIITALTYTFGVVPLSPLIYTAAAGDVVTIFGDVSVLPTAGAIDCVGAEIYAIRLK